MSRRSRKHRKHFSCGHRGFGKYCHRCADQAQWRNSHRAILHQQQAQKQRRREAWQLTFESDVVDLRKLPKPVVLKARAILSQLSQGTPYWQLAGKRLHSARQIIRIPVTRRYRLLCQDDGERLVALKVVSHERYNLLINRIHRWLA